MRHYTGDKSGREDEEIYCICKSIKEGRMIECEDKTVGFTSVELLGSTFPALDSSRSLRDSGFAPSVLQRQKTRAPNFFSHWGLKIILGRVFCTGQYDHLGLLVEPACRALRLRSETSGSAPPMRQLVGPQSRQVESRTGECR